MRLAFAGKSLAAVAASVIFTGSAAAQKVAGEWIMRYERPATMSYGEKIAPAEVRARVTLRQIGDSIFGAWLYSALPGEPAAQANELRGVLHHDTASVSIIPIVDADANMFLNFAQNVVDWMKSHVHGIAPTATLLEFTVRGDSLSGVRRVMAVDGSAKDRVFPLSGARVKQ